MNIAIVTACHQGLVGCHLVAKVLELAAQKKQWQATVETQSQIGQGETLSTEAIAQAEIIIIATQSPVDLERFSGKRIYQGTIQAALDDPDRFLTKASTQALYYQGSLAAQQPNQTPIIEDEPELIVAITACPTGIAHTFLAAEALESYIKEQGYAARVETRGSVGVQNELTAEDIDKATFVIIAADIDVDLTRFKGKRLYKTSTGRALKHTQVEFDKALKHAEIYQGNTPTESTQTQASPVAPQTESFSAELYRHLLTGVSFMLPVVVAGGLMIALSFMFGIHAFEQEGTLAANLMKIGGGSAFALMIPVLAGYIAYSIADRPGLAPGMIGGMLASQLGAGFLGGIIAGFLGGYLAQMVSRGIQVPQSMEALKPILIIPLFASLLTGLIMIYVVGQPVAQIMQDLTGMLNNMGQVNAILLGALLGAMMCFDMGGPVNKAAYTFGVGLLTSNTYAPMAAIMAAGMVPALGMGIATFVGRRKFQSAEHEAGKASFVLGLCFITEGAIPFAAKDPMRVIPVCMLGGSIAGALSMYFNCHLLAPHGGLFVLFIPHAITHVALYVLSIAIGACITGLGYILIKPQTSEVS